MTYYHVNPLADTPVDLKAGWDRSYCIQHKPPHLAEEPMDSFEEVYELHVEAEDTESSVFRDALRDEMEAQQEQSSWHGVPR